MLLNECPEVIGSMSMVISGGGSLEGAVRDVAANGPVNSREMFSSVVRDADTRVQPDMRTALGNVLSSLPEGAAPYSMAVRMVVSASVAHDESERDRLLAEARSIALSGLRDAGRMYSASLNAPCMIVFGVGIMVPMVLMSVLPMLNVSGTLGGSALDPFLVSFVTLVLIPLFICGVMLSIRDRNPFIKGTDPFTGAASALPLLSALPVAALLLSFGWDGVHALCVSVAVAGALTFVLLIPGYREERARRRREDLLKESVFDMGNYLLAGMPFEESFRAAVSVRSDCAGVSRALSTEFALCRGDCRRAVVDSIAPTSPVLAQVFAEIYTASLKDVRESGRLAHSLGRQIMDQDTVRRGIRADLKGMTDTMNGTAALFAPLVLGLSVTILGPLSRISDSVDVAGTSLTLSVYLVELCGLISCMLAFLEGTATVAEVVRRASLMLPVSLLVFIVTTSLRL